MCSRLDRLFQLLESDNTCLHHAAVQRIGNIASQCPDQLTNLLNKLNLCFEHKQWQTRTSAGKALLEIVHKYPSMVDCSIGAMDLTMVDSNHKFLKLNHFNLRTLLNSRMRFYRISIGDLYDPNSHQNNTAEAKSDLKSQFGMRGLVGEALSSHSMSFTDIICDEDLNDTCSTSYEQPEVQALMNILSDKSNNHVCVEECPPEKRIKKETDSNNVWPFISFYQRNLSNLWSLTWETRHGAAVALRDLLQGRMEDFTSTEGHISNNLGKEELIEDCTVRILTTLLLDSFFDFMSDETVAPVCETCAQVVGVLSRILTNQQIHLLIAILLEVLQCSDGGQIDWMHKYNSLLAIKYIFAARKDLLNELLPQVHEALINEFMQNNVDDIQTCISNVLQLVIDWLDENAMTSLQILSQHLIQTLTQDQGADFSAASSALLDLFVAICETNCFSQSLSQPSDVEVIACTVLPYLYHASTSVRTSAVRCLRSLFMAAVKQNIEFSTRFSSVFLTQIYQRLLLESGESLLTLLEDTWKCLLSHTSPLCAWEVLDERIHLWMCQIMQAPCVRYSPTMLALPQAILVRDAPNYDPTSGSMDTNDMEKYLIGGEETLNMPDCHRDISVMERRLRVVDLLGCTLSKIVEDCLSDLNEELSNGLNTLLIQTLLPAVQNNFSQKVAMSRFVSAALLRAFYQHLSIQSCQDNSSSSLSVLSTFSTTVHTILVKSVSEVVYYEESLGLFRSLQADCNAFKIALLERRILSASQIDTSSGIIHCRQKLDTIWNELGDKIKDEINDHYQRAILSLDDFQRFQILINARVRGMIACAILSIQDAPLLEKWSPIIVPCMDILRSEVCTGLQRMSARGLSQLLSRVRLLPPPNPADKVVSNVCSLIQPKQLPSCQDCVSLSNDEAICSQIGLLNSINVSSVTVDQLLNMHQHSIPANGAVFALRAFVEDSSSNLQELVPKLWNVIYLQITRFMENMKSFDWVLTNQVDGVSLQTSLCIFNICVQVMKHGESSSSYTVLLDHMLPQLLSTMKQCRDCSLRHFISSSIACLIFRTLELELPNSIDVLETVLLDLLNELNDIHVNKSQSCLASLELLYYVSGCLKLTFLSYGMVFMVPILTCCSHPCRSVRTLANSLFGQLLMIMPLATIDKSPVNMSEEWNKIWCQHKELVTSLLQPNSIANVKIPGLKNAELRSYQQDGVNWLMFLHRFGLHGLLCDDLGLGKSLQALCMLSISHQMLANSNHSQIHRSLIICPASLLGHWECETEKFINSSILNPLALTGGRDYRARVYEDLGDHNLIIVSYDMVRKDVEILKGHHWNYIVLDEGHVIRKGLSKISVCVKQLPSVHRLILTGTPVQNHALDLWSLFDFLMPGFLGTSSQFHCLYGRSIVASREAKTSSKEMLEGEKALQTLHRQVLPFLLRRLKNDVLQELPPKIIQDYPCYLTPLQRRLYTSFQDDIFKHIPSFDGVDDKETALEDPSAKGFMLKALMYLRKVANHPKLVLHEGHPQYEEIVQELRANNDQTLEDPILSGKLQAFLDLLRECGIGVEWDDHEEEPVLSQHRALVFCHTKSMLDLIENAVRKHVPKATWLRLDGSVPLKDRHAITTQFNEDPSIDLLLLTTSVGGLGLNLTGADTVIFVDNDWNPMKDLQAMDRAHRIGQKRVVNVYRFITVDTIEEKIMNLQIFKKHIADSVITKENQSLTSMATENLFELFDKKSSLSAKGKHMKPGDNSSAVSSKSILQNMENFWDEEEYSDEFNVNSFVKKIDRLSH